jgi:hypothetical protein
LTIHGIEGVLTTHWVPGFGRAVWIGSLSALRLKPCTLLFEARSFAHEPHTLLEVTLLDEPLALLYELLPVLHEALANVLKLVILLSA